jgi:hypothetical protein
MKKKVITKSILFIGCAIVFYIALFALLSKVSLGNTKLIYHATNYLSWKGGNTYQKFEEFNPNEKYDIVVIGSSHAYRGYDPRIFKRHGINMFNLGTSGQAMLNTQYLVRNYINKKNCKLLIVDIYEAGFSGNGLESSSDLSQNITINTASRQICLELGDPRGLNMYALRLANSNENPSYYDSTYISGGYSSISDSAKSDIDYTIHSDVFKGSHASYNGVKNIIEYAKQEKIKLLFVQHPTPKKYDRRTHASFVNQLEEVIEKEVPYWDYAYDHSLHYRYHFADHNHLNQSGVDIFNERLISKIKKKYSFNR